MRIVSQVDTYGYGSADESTGIYKYALVRMAPGDTVPTLLLEQDAAFGISYVLVFRYDVESKTVLQAAGALMESVASAGGFRGGLAMMSDGMAVASWSCPAGAAQRLFPV